MDIKVDDPQLAALIEGDNLQEETVEVDTTEGDTATQEQTQVSEPAREEKPAEASKPDPKSDHDDSETIAEDETGKRYIPEKRFKDVYAKLKAYERGEIQAQTPAPQPQVAPTPAPANLPKEEAIEVELLAVKYPQFDPSSEKYDRSLDELGAEIYRANPGITRTEAARRAMSFQKKLAQEVSEERSQARLVKAVQSDQGITNRTQAREVTSEPETLEEMEAFLKKNGAW